MSQGRWRRVADTSSTRSQCDDPVAEESLEVPQTTFLDEDDFVDRRNSSTKLIGIASLLVVAFLMVPCVIALLLPAVQQGREASRRTLVLQKMRAMGQGVQQFHDTYQHLPPIGVLAALSMPQLQGRPWEIEFPCTGCDQLLTTTNQNLSRSFRCPHCQQIMDVPAWGPSHSWMTYLLPYLDEQPLYDSIHFDKAWSAPENVSVFSRELPQFWNPSEPRPYSNLQGYGLAYVAANSNLIKPAKPVRLVEVTDGASNTLFAAQVHAGLKAWGDPSNHRDPAQGLRDGEDSFGSPHGKTVYALMLDGSVRPLSKDLSPEIFRAMGTPAGGEVPEKN